jgi:tetratricopeptide (TPR) repeat protein
MHEVIAELDGLDLHGAPTLLPGSMPALPHRSPRRTAIVAASVVMVIALGGWTVGSRWLQRRSQVVAGPPVSLAILPFRNASGDATLDSLGSSVSEVLRTEVGQSARVRTVPSDRVHQVLQDLRIAPNATLTPADVTRAAEFTSAGSVLWGQVTRFGSAIRIDATLQDLDRQQTIPLNARAPNEEGLLAAISQLAEVVRQNLARGSTEVLNDLKSTSWKPSTASFEAVRLYNEGAQLTRDGKPQEALKRFEESTTQDHSFALAFSALARSYATLGRDIEAAQSSGRAMSLAEALPPQEKYLISANHYRIANDTTKAIESYEHLVAASANDATVQFDVGELYEQSGDYEQARQHFAKVVELDPKLAQGLLALGRVEIRGGHPQDSLDHLTRALTLAIQVNNDEARANILHAIGVAYKRLNRPNEALPQFKESLALKERLGDRRGMAASLGEIGQLQQTQGKMPDAKQSYQDALKLQRAIGSTSGTAESLINLAVLFNDHLGRPDDALPLLQEALLIRRTGGNKNAEALVLNNIGNVYLAKGQYSDAQTNFERALELREKANVPREIADTLHDLAETLLKMGHYDQSLTQYHRALDLRRTSGDRRAEAIERYSMGTVFDYQASYGKAVQSKEEALGTFRDLKGRDMWLGEILGGYGNSLSLSGQMDQATTHLDEAMTVANELQNATLVAQTRRFQADRLYYSGDVKGASRVAEQALKDATSAADRSLALQARSAVAITAASIRPTQGLASQLATLARDADTLGLRFLSVDCSIQRAVTLLKLGDRVNARQEVERSLARAETLGSRLLLAKAHYVRAAALGPGHDADARVDYTSALRLLEDIKREEGNQHVLMRADLSAMYEECLAKSKGT